MSAAVSSRPRSAVETRFGVSKIEELRYRGNQPLEKPAKTSRGVYGGNLCAQAILVSLETVPAGFTPHSLHSYFVKAGDDATSCEYDVEKLSDGRNFASRLIKVSQGGELKYIIMISLTKRNSSNEKTFEFQKKVPKTFYQYNLKDLYENTNDSNNRIHHKLPPNYLDPKIDQENLSKSAGDRDCSYWIRFDDEHMNKESNLKYSGFGVISDSLFLTSLSRILNLPSNIAKIGKSGGKGEHFFSVSLDHSIYFHDDSFDPTKWCFFNYKAPRLNNNRVLIQGDFYDEQGKLFASIVQEGLIFFHGGSELKAKL
ncbi:hypothetical protein HYPBUDRAFT_243866 [Hyphopichia burtonii NRRL Y-1933]|uniref:Thioesterase/thiol ester dehydrase-isomerase n=1 Tax=Hyphopichia burtonii NRRL Y-1933 TaxID=984485 RepID=A0A1E4RCT9_9ASCO|nr:hypothetical protein HYPBUDRAFT_243866 [Hyphopichia burtonii NRRL Y-1933]ODV65072.1 hypothetical protein HYPBUDRAFT_243866 [Hyphopichia burtonii NRRL Y-1933]